AAQGDPRRRRETGGPNAGGSRQDPFQRACVAAIALSANARRHLRRKELDDRVPAAYRSDRAAAAVLETRLSTTHEPAPVDKQVWNSCRSFDAFICYESRAEG